MPSHSPVRSPPRTPATLVRQIKLLFRACRFADDEGEFEVTEQHVRDAHEYLEQAAVERGIKSLPLQRALALLPSRTRQ